MISAADLVRINAILSAAGLGPLCPSGLRYLPEIK